MANVSWARCARCALAMDIVTSYPEAVTSFTRNTHTLSSFDSEHNTCRFFFHVIIASFCLSSLSEQNERRLIVVVDAVRCRNLRIHTWMPSRLWRVSAQRANCNDRLWKQCFGAGECRHILFAQNECKLMRNMMCVRSRSIQSFNACSNFRDPHSTHTHTHMRWMKQEPSPQPRPHLHTLVQSLKLLEHKLICKRKEN